MTRLALPLVMLLAVTSVHAAEDYTDPPITKEEQGFWAFQPPKRSTVPSVKASAWVRNPVDAFILAKLEALGLKPSPEADRLTLIRRVTLDLTGLPPTPAEIEAFLNDPAPNAYEKVVDRLLASPHFGERAAQHWLDVVRFAESNGYEADGERPHAWRYRDYVIRSFNDDKPYDRFLTEQIAGDELAVGKEPRDVAELWIATGVHRCGPVHNVGGNLDADMIRQEVLTEMVSGFGSAVLGLTVSCARCHDHKFDPISQGDYYRLQAFFANARYTEIDLATEADRAARKRAVEELNARIGPLKGQVSQLDAPYREQIAKAKRAALEPKYRQALDTPSDKRTPEQKKLVADANPLLKVSWDEVLAAMTPADRERRASLRELIHTLDARMPPPAAAAWAIKADGAARTYVLKRGSTKNKWTLVEAAFPRVLVSAESQPRSRTELARWITRADHPLTARVMVNRLWQQHFGRGIVATPNDFGIRGDRPTHPELLDWLATEFVGRGWSLKHIHRLLVTSATYRQSSSVERGPRNVESRTRIFGIPVPHSAFRTPQSHDPDNTLLWRMNRRRLDAEGLRDSILAVAGTLNPQLGGRSVKVPLEPEVYDLIFTEGEPDGLWPVTPDPTQHVRRSIYLFNKRNVRLPLFEAFDQPDTLNSCAVRPVSTFAPQSLILMNGPFVQEQGKAFAVRLVRDVGTDPRKQIDLVYRRALGRAPTDAERALALEFLAEQAETIRDRLKARLPVGLDPALLPANADIAAVRALADLCIVVFNTNEFVYVP